MIILIAASANNNQMANIVKGRCTPDKRAILVHLGYKKSQGYANGLSKHKKK